MNDQNIEHAQPQIPDRRAQLQILLLKTIKVLNRNWGFYLFHILIVPLVLFIIVYLNRLVRLDSVLQKESFYTPYELPQFKKCSAPHCLSLGIVLLSVDFSSEVTPWIQSTINHLQQELGLEQDTDIKMIYRGNQGYEIIQTMKRHSEIGNMVYFCNDFVGFHNSTISIDCDSFKVPTVSNVNLNVYGLAYNQTKIGQSYIKDTSLPLEIDINSVVLKKTIDSFLVEYYRQQAREVSFEDSSVSFGSIHTPESYTIKDAESTKRSVKKTSTQKGKLGASNDDFSYDLNIMSYMKPKLSFLSRYDFSVGLGGFFYLFIILLSFSQFTKLLAIEKGQKLRRGLIPFGLSATSYWGSWIIFALALNMLLSLYIMLIGILFDIIIFTDTPFIITFTVIYATCNAYSLLAMVITAFSSDFKSANKTSYTFIVISVFFEIFFSQRGIITLLFLEDKPLLIWMLSHLLDYLPSLPFSIIISNLTYSVGYYFDTRTDNYVKGPGYNFTNYITSQEYESKFEGKIYIPSDCFYHAWLIYLSLLYLIGLWIADNLIESNNGYRRSVWAFLKRKANILDFIALEEPLLDLEPSNVLFELKGIDKTYKLDFLGYKTIHALKNLSLKIYNNEILALLGENGAGKSTLISIMAGNLKANQGVILYKGKEFGVVNEHRMVVSICPQYDLLWDDLTVYENMNLIGQYRGLTTLEIDLQIIDILEKLDLTDQSNTIVRFLSGGMKRRISIGIALIGNPQLVILDEPTTGLDPVHRKHVWNFIKELKNRGKAVMLTTHIMDEADYLADRIAIINRGQLLKVNTSAAIKDEFKQFNVILSLKQFDGRLFHKLTELFREFYGSKFSLKYQSNSLVKFNIPGDDMSLTTRFVHVLEHLESHERYSQLTKLIDSFEVSSLDLEEAYMLVNEQHKL